MEECISLAARLHDERLEGFAHWALAENDWVQGRIDAVPEQLEQWVDRPGVRNDDRHFVLRTLARVYLEMRNLARARELLERAASVPQAPPWIASEESILLSLLLEREGRMDEAREAYEESLRLSRKAEFSLGEALALSAIAGMETQLDGPEKMRARYVAAIAIFERLGATPLVERTQAALERL
jgi:tetratricopeptide (TPR) repeat protein